MPPPTIPGHCRKPASTTSAHWRPQVGRATPEAPMTPTSPPRSAMVMGHGVGHLPVKLSVVRAERGHQVAACPMDGPLNTGGKRPGVREQGGRRRHVRQESQCLPLCGRVLLQLLRFYSAACSEPIGRHSEDQREGRPVPTATPARRSGACEAAGRGVPKAATGRHDYPPGRAEGRSRRPVHANPPPERRPPSVARSVPPTRLPNGACLYAESW